MKNLLKLFFINGFITMCNRKMRLRRLAFWVLLQAMKTNGKAMKITLLRLPTINKKYHSVEHLQRQQFSFTKTNEYLSVSKMRAKIWSKMCSLAYRLHRLNRLSFFACVHYESWRNGAGYSDQPEVRTQSVLKTVSKIGTKYNGKWYCHEL